MLASRTSFVGKVVGTMVAAALLISAAIPFHAQADEQNTNWFGGAPTLHAKQDVPAWSLQTPNCIPTTINVLRNYLDTKEQHCMMQTAAGLIDNQTTVIQPQGSATAYPIRAYVGTGILPVPNQAGALFIKSSGAQGMNIGYYKNLFSHLKLDYNLGSPQYYILDNPDLWFRGADNSPMQFNMSTLAFSPNGRYFIADALNRFVKIDTLNLNVVPFADTLYQVDHTGLLEASTAIDNDGRYATIGYNAPAGWGQKFFKIVDTTACANTPQYGIYAQLPFTCKTTDVYSHVSAGLAGLSRIGSVAFMNDHVITFDARIFTDGVFKNTHYSMVASGQKESLLDFLAIGDSYISGEGAFSYKYGTNTDRNRCHQSLIAYPYLLGAKFDSYASVACSGAKMINVTGNSQDKGVVGQLKDHAEPLPAEEILAQTFHLPGIVAQKTFLKQDLPESVLLSIGGNDIGFADIVKSCVDVTHAGNTCYSTYEEREALLKEINSKFPELKHLYADIKDEQNANRRLYVIGYPQIAKIGGNCGANVHLDADEVKFGSELIIYLNSVIKKAAEETGVYYVDVAHALDGYRLCETADSSIAVNGATLVDSTTFPWISDKESYHPNKKGHELLADAVAAKTAKLTAPMPEPTPSTAKIVLDQNASILKNIPKAGVEPYARRSADLAPDSMLKGQAINVRVDAEQYNLKPSSDFDVTLHSDPIQLGTFKSDSSGNLAFSVQIPDTTPPGYHTLHIYGPDIFGNKIDIQDVVYIAASETDYDGDGIINDKDSCALIVTSGQDSDKDNIDDSCDPLVDGPSTPSPNPPSINATEDISLSVLPPVSAASQISIITAPLSQVNLVPQAPTAIAGAQLQIENTANGVVLGEKSNAIAQRMKDTASNTSSRHGSTTTIILLISGLAGLVSAAVLAIKWRSRKPE